MKNHLDSNLRDQVVTELGAAEVKVLTESPPEEESPSNGCIESCVIICKEMICVHLAAFESKIFGESQN